MAKKEKVSDQLKPISIEAAKLLQGMSLVFTGAVKMLEAIEPHVHVDGGFALNLLTGNIPALEEMGRQLKAEEKEEAEKAAGADKHNDATESDKAEDTAEDSAEQPEQTDKPKAPISSVTADDITRIIVGKIKQNKDNNEKIGQILATYGVKKVSALKPEQYESFVTDLAAI